MNRPETVSALRSACRTPTAAWKPTSSPRRNLPRQGERPDEPHRVLGRACRGRSARRCRSLAAGRHRLGPTIAYRERLWDLGLGVAEAMDTAQRGMGLDWPTSLELIRRSVAAAKARGDALVFSGAGTDHLAPEAARSIDDVIRAYEEQFAAIEAFGGRIILMASRALARVAKSADDYVKVYDRILSQAKRAGDHPLARRHVRSGARRLLGHRAISTPRWTRAVSIINAMRTRSTA